MDGSGGAREGCPNDVFCDCEFEGLDPKDGCLIAPGVPAPEPEPAAFAPQGLPIHLDVSFDSAPFFFAGFFPLAPGGEIDDGIMRLAMRLARARRGHWDPNPQSGSCTFSRSLCRVWIRWWACGGCSACFAHSSLATPSPGLRRR